MKAGLEVWKFGGASVADGRAIQRAADQIAAHKGPLVVVVSALAGVTDLLLEATPQAAEAFQRKHRQAARAVLGPGPALRRMLAQIDASTREYQDVCTAVQILGHL
jgi:aspartokinase